VKIRAGLFCISFRSILSGFIQLLSSFRLLFIILPISSSLYFRIEREVSLYYFTLGEFFSEIIIYLYPMIVMFAGGAENQSGSLRDEAIGC